jgi:S-adenosyl-L-methionine hydrolase (adenosine-forming)
MTYQHISFFSDYGTRDEFVGVVKSVIADIAPHVTVIDITHDIPAYDVRAGSLAVARAVPYMARSVVLAVVDPGVGSSRRAIAVEVDGGVFVGPDNGLLGSGVALAGGALRAVELTNTEFHIPAPGATFAGRDVFGPVAAHLCNGVTLDELGTAIDPAGILPGLVPLPRHEGERLLCEVTWIDHFGNCQLNVGAEDAEAFGSRVMITIGSENPATQIVRSVPIVSSYQDIGGGLGLVVDSYGMLSLCTDRGSAAREVDASTGMGVIIERGDDAGVVTSVQIGRPPVRP